ncbi:MAG: hypothetical protein ABSE86_13970, partial [Bryobacteraceae bacterium]
MKRYCALLALLSSAGWAQRSLAPPQVGFMQDSQGGIRPVTGLAGNFLVGRAASTGIVSAGFSGAFGMLKSDSALTVIDQQGRAITSVDAPAGPALFAFSIDESPALAYFQQSKTLAVWDGHTFHTVPLETDDTVLSISSPTALIVQRDSGLWELGVDLATGAIVWQTALPGVTAPVLMLASGG